MKPVIKKQTHYTVVLMREDGGARTMQVRIRTLRILLGLIIFLIAGGAASIAGGARYWEKYMNLNDRNKTQEKEIAEMRLQLERLSNLESLLVAKNGSIPLAKHEEVGVGAPAYRLQNGLQNANGAAPAGASGQAGAANAAVPGAANAAGVAGAAGVQSQNPAGAAQNVAAPPAADGANTVKDEPAGQVAKEDPAQVSEAQPPGLPSLGSESSPLRINSFTGRSSGQQRLRIRYELAATSPSQDQRLISGSTKYKAVLNNGSQIDLPLQDSAETRFSIARMKMVDATIRMPQGYSARDVSSIDVFIEVEDGSVYHSTFALSN